VLVGVGETAASVTQVHVVERRARHRRGPHRQARVIERSEDGWQGRCAFVGAGADVRAVHPDLAHGRHPLQDGQQPAAFGVISEFYLHGVAVELPLEFVGCALGDDAPPVHDDKVASEPVGFLEVVGGQQDGEPVVGGQPPDLLLHGLA